jgi:hypothetical protein
MVRHRLAAPASTAPYYYNERVSDVSNLSRSVVTEPDEAAAPFVFVYIFGVIAWLSAVLAWVFYFRGYA